MWRASLPEKTRGRVLLKGESSFPFDISEGNARRCRRDRLAFSRTQFFFAGLASLWLSLLVSFPVQAQEQLLIAYGSVSETNIPLWVGVEKGFFKKHGLGVRMVQVSGGPLIMSALASGDVQLVSAAVSSVLSGVSAGMKVSCVASPNSKMLRRLMVRPEIKTLAELKDKVFGVQSIGGGNWLQAMIVLDHLGIDPEKYQLKVRVIGNEATIAQALIKKNIDAAVVPYSFSEPLKRAGFQSLADAGEIRIPYHSGVICAQRSMIASHPDVVERLLEGVVEAVVFVHEPKNRQEVTGILKKRLRLEKREDIEASYNVLRLTTTVDVSPNVEVFRTAQRILTRMNPKIGKVDIDQVVDRNPVRKLEESGFLPEMRKKLIH